MSGRRISMIVAALVVGATLVAGAMAAGQGYKQVGKWGKVGTGNGQFGNGVFGLATSKGGNVYAADTSNNRIQVFTAKGGFVDKFGALGARERAVLGAERCGDRSRRERLRGGLLERPRPEAQRRRRLPAGDRREPADGGRRRRGRQSLRRRRSAGG